MSDWLVKRRRGATNWKKTITPTNKIWVRGQTKTGGNNGWPMKMKEEVKWWRWRGDDDDDGEEEEEREGEEQLVLRSVRMSALPLSGVSGHRLALSVTPPPFSLAPLHSEEVGGWGGGGSLHERSSAMKWVTLSFCSPPPLSCSSFSVSFLVSASSHLKGRLPQSPLRTLTISGTAVILIGYRQRNRRQPQCGNCAPPPKKNNNFALKLKLWWDFYSRFFF